MKGQPRQFVNLAFWGMVTLFVQAGNQSHGSAQTKAEPKAEPAPRAVDRQSTPAVPQRASKGDGSKAVPTKTEPRSVSPGQQTPGQRQAPASPKGELAERNVSAPDVNIRVLSKPLETVRPPAARKAPAASPSAEPKVASVAVPPVTPVERSQPAVNRADVALRERVLEALAQDKSLTYSARSVRVGARDGEIILSGALNTQLEKVRVAQIASRVAGARVVRDDLIVRTEKRPVR